MAIDYSSNPNVFISDSTTLLGGLGYDLTKKIWLLALKSYFFDKRIDSDTLIQIAHLLFEIYNDYSQVIDYGDKELVVSLEMLDELIGEDPTVVAANLEKILDKENVYLMSQSKITPKFTL